jgi:Skp family chaperone for outer membrane proteins
MKILNSLILSILILLSSTIAASEIGFIDTDLIFQKAKFVQTFRENFTEKEKDFNEILQKKSKKIEEAIAKGKPEDEIRELVKKRDTELEPKKKELMQYEISFRQNFLLNVTTTAKKVAEEYKIDVVLDKQVIYHGGYDLTDLVLNQLNK